MQCRTMETLSTGSRAIPVRQAWSKSGRAVAVLVAAVSAYLAIACQDSAAPGVTGILLQVTVTDGASVPLDSGLAVVAGPTSKTVRLAPGASVAIDGLAPGTYTVALEGFAANVIALAGQTPGVQVVSGHITIANLTLSTFQPTVYAVPSPGGLEVSVDSLAGAARYVVEWASDSTFSNPDDTTTAARRVEIPLASMGRFYVRAKAVGRPSASSRTARAPRT
jgi:hypothetical protein